MTLDIESWIKQAITKQSEISHNEIAFDVRDSKRLPSKIKSLMQDKFGDSFLEDCQYVIFFKKYEDFSDKDKQKIFALTNNGLGKAANNMTQSDFKTFSVEDSETTMHFLVLKVTIK